ncbi:MAG: sensor histidine kinase [Desulfovibrionales bacterium]
MVVTIFREGLSLRLSLLLFLVIPLIGICGAGGFYSLKLLEAQIEERMQDDIELIARAIRGPLEHALEQGREGSLSQALDSVFRFERVYGAYVYGTEGQRIARSGPRETGIRGRQVAELAAGGDRIGEYQESDGKQMYSFFIPLSDSLGRNTGLLQLTRDGADFQEYIQQVRRQGLLLLLLLSILLPGIVVYGHHRVIGRNLGLLVRSMARIESGHREHRANLSGPREVRHLADGMNSMLDSIARAEKKLEQQRQDQTKLERQLQQSRKMAAIGQLASGVAHELGTPLSVVSGKAQRLLRRSDLPEPAVRAFHEIRVAVQRMEQIVRQLLDYGRSNPLRLRPRKLNDLAHCAAAHLRKETEDLSVTMTINGPEPAPMLEVDSVRMEQALINLLRNGVQAAGPGGTVAMEWFETRDCLGIHVADDGPGVPEALHSKLFEPFFTTKSVDQGTGLGLSVAQSATRDHGGRLEVGRSTLGGARFSMIFKK